MTWSQLFQEYGIWGSFWGLSMGVMLFVLSKLVSLGRLERGIEAVDHRLTTHSAHLHEQLSTWATQFDKRLDRVGSCLEGLEGKLDQLLAK